MRSPRTVRSVEAFGRTRLSRTFFMRDFLFSEIAAMQGMRNLPANPDLAIEAGRNLCEHLLEPLQATFGRLAIRSAYRSPEVNGFGNAHNLSCASNERDRARHIWDERDAEGRMGAMTTIASLPWFPRAGDPTPLNLGGLAPKLRDIPIRYRHFRRPP
jgi:hypothetical protein